MKARAFKKVEKWIGIADPKSERIRLNAIARELFNSLDIPHAGAKLIGLLAGGGTMVRVDGKVSIHFGENKQHRVYESTIDGLYFRGLIEFLPSDNRFELTDEGRNAATVRILAHHI